MEPKQMQRDQLEEILEEAMERINRGHFKKASHLLRTALEKSPNYVPAYFGLAIASLLQGSESGFEKQMRLAYEHASQEDEKVMVLLTKARFLMEYEDPETALEVLEECQELHPGHSHYLNTALMEAYLELGREEEAWNVVQSAIPSPETQRPEHFPIFRNWLFLMMELEKWNLRGKIENRVKQFLKTVEEEEERSRILEVLLEEHEEYIESVLYREAELFADLAHYVAPDNQLVQEARKQTQQLIRVERELHRMEQDEKLFPPVHLQALRFFYGDLMDSEEMEEIMEEIPADMLEELEGMNEEYAAGIVRLKKKYPLVYKQFETDWDDLYEEKAAGLNREARRRLR